MSIFKHIDRDKVVGFLAFYWWAPFGEWFIGIPDEPMFLHEVIKRWQKHRNPWDIGLRSRVPVHHYLAQLHRKGKSRSDKFGSDFALTVDVRGPVSFRKTAIFQTKVGDNHSATVERQQLEDALSVPEFVGRAFTIALDRERASLRIQSVDVLSAAFSACKGTKRFDTTEWFASSNWMTRWLECDIGRPSSITEADTIEGLLFQHISEAPDGFPRYERSGDPGVAFVPDLWLHATITIDQNA
jgi:hypothetical protein